MAKPLRWLDAGHLIGGYEQAGVWGTAVYALDGALYPISGIAQLVGIGPGR